MAGPYRVSFDFLEVVRYDPSLKPDAPYQSWGTEYRVRRRGPAGLHRAPARPGDARAAGRRQGERADGGAPLAAGMALRGAASARVRGRATAWARRAVPADERRGAWVQSVLQVDDSPRYAARGRWKHEGGLSTWISGRDLAPAAAARVQRAQGLRRAGRHQPPHHHAGRAGCRRRTISSSRWRSEARRLLAREYGVARYERIRDYDFGPGETLLSSAPSRSGPRCAPRGASSRRDAAASRCARRSTRAQLFMPFFEYAQKLADGAAVRPRSRARLRAAHAAGALPQVATTGACSRSARSRTGYRRSGSRRRGWRTSPRA